LPEPVQVPGIADHDAPIVHYPVLVVLFITNIFKYGQDMMLRRIISNVTPQGFKSFTTKGAPGELATKFAFVGVAALWGMQ